MIVDFAKLKYKNSLYFIYFSAFSKYISFHFNGFQNYGPFTPP